MQNGEYVGFGNTTFISDCMFDINIFYDYKSQIKFIKYVVSNIRSNIDIIYSCCFMEGIKMKKREIGLVINTFKNACDFPLWNILNGLIFIGLVISFIMLFPIQLLVWLFNKKEFAHTCPYLWMISVLDN